MEYLSIRELAIQFAIKERTAYHYVANNKNIRFKKQWRTKLIHIADFARACGKELQSLQGEIISEVEVQSKPDVAISQPESQDLQQEIIYEAKTHPNWEVAKLQKSLQALQQENDTQNERLLYLQTLNSDLKTNLARHKELHNEERNERKELAVKVEKYAKKYSLLQGICFGLIAILLIQVIPTVLEIMSFSN